MPNRSLLPPLPPSSPCRWDSITQQRYFSFEALLDFLGQVLRFERLPEGLEAPAYLTLKRLRGYEVRRYDAFPVAQAPMVAAPGVEPPSPAAAAGGGRAFGALASYLFGGNAAGRRMRMTTPVLSDGAVMQFPIGPKDCASADAMPAPLAPGSVTALQRPGGVYAVRAFSGIARPEEVERQVERLRAALLRDGGAALGMGCAAVGSVWLARFNDPSTPGPLRRNEVMLELRGFDVWGTANPGDNL
jgi:hypothetical protein